MSLLVVKGNIVAALPMKGWYVCKTVLYNVFLHVGYIYIHLYTYIRML